MDIYYDCMYYIYRRVGGKITFLCSFYMNIKKLILKFRPCREILLSARKCIKNVAKMLDIYELCCYDFYKGFSPPKEVKKSTTVILFIYFHFTIK
jgi:hypothetical protein